MRKLGTPFLYWLIFFLAVFLAAGPIVITYIILPNSDPIVSSQALLWEAAIASGALMTGVIAFIVFFERQRRSETQAILDATTHLRQRDNDLSEALANAQKFRQAVEQSADQIIITDADGTILYANAAVETLTGFSPKEVIGKKAGAKELWGGHMPKEFYQHMWHVIKEEKLPFRGEIRNRRKDGKMYDAATTISPILDAQGNVEYFVATERDISREKELERLQSEFVSIASHQLRTPLGGIRWVAERLMEKQNNSQEGRQYLQDILSSTKNLASLVDLLLNVSRIEREGGSSVEIEPVDLIVFLKNIISELTPVADKHEITLTFHPSEKEIQMQTDPGALRNIVQTYLSNALEYTPKGGSVDLRSKLIDGKVQISVQDTGIGVPKDAQEHLFEKFTRAENAKRTKPSGTGLGLYLAKKAAELLGGKVWFESTEGKGSTFYAQIPLVSKERKGGKPLA